MAIRRGTIIINENDIIGKRLGKLEITGYAGNRYDMTLGGRRLRHFYTVKCDCGVTKVIRRSSLKSEIVNSCGCKRRKHNGY